MIERNKTPFTADRLLVMCVWFADNDQQNSPSYIGNADLTDTYMSLSSSHLYDTLAAKTVYFEDSPPKVAAAATAQSTAPPESVRGASCGASWAA